MPVLLAKCDETEALTLTGHGTIGIGRMVYVADTDEQAKEEASESVVKHVDSFKAASTSYLGKASEASQQELQVDYEKLEKIPSSTDPRKL